MAIKTFNLDERAYNKFHRFCKERGMSMSRQIEFFIEDVVEEKPVKKSYLKKIDKILKKNEFIRVKDINDIL